MCQTPRGDPTPNEGAKTLSRTQRQLQAKAPNLFRGTPTIGSRSGSVCSYVLTSKEITQSAGSTPSMRRPVRVKIVLFFLSVDPYFLAEPPLSPSFHPQSFMSDFRSLQGGRPQFSRCCYLIIDLAPIFWRGVGPGVSRSHLISADELGC